ncbi:hypothetical protein Bpfe_019957 [Biomphalaria pfeifferi]|uniref:Uncharacterized protein n=1 Tax=Biomphalaria pfeifferi TaxID=112525 RepID=A0AAD8B9J8_BIOPF|nr:hypothetical protein Bpfe_019957 [Biomphalaria pfeifferi]
MVSQAKEEIGLLVKKQLPVDLLVKKLHDLRLLSEDDCGALDFDCNVAACEHAAPLRGVCREGLPRQRVRLTAVLKKTVLDTTSVCVKRPRHRRNNSLVNWRKKKRHWRKTMRMASWVTRSLPPVAPTDRPPPELSNLSCSVSFRVEKCQDGWQCYDSAMRTASAEMRTSSNQTRKLC